MRAHLFRLYEAFQLDAGDEDGRRVALAQAAIRTGTVTAADVEEPDDGE